MKRSLVLAASLLFCALRAGAPAFADEEAEVYRQIYVQSEGLSQKYAAAVNLVGLNDKSTAPVLAEGLQGLLANQNNYRNPSDKELYAQTVRVISAALGNYKYGDADSLLWQVVQQVPEPLARSEALMALGSMRALDYAERISLLLRNLDIAPTGDRDSDEKVAYGCIIALQKLKDVRGFAPVFYAADGWYSQRVRQLALSALPNIAADPTDAIKEIIRTEGPDRKLLALKQNAVSQASPARKSEAALLALSEGQNKVSRDRSEERTMAELRKLALRSLVSFRSTGADSVSADRYSYENGYDDEERLLALQALGANGCDEAAASLRDVILQLDRDQLNGISDETRNRMAKAAIENAALTRNKAVKSALIAVSMNDKWSGSIILAAQNAVKAMP
jgi:hypothetical protein